MDNNEVQTISHKCEVLSIEEYKKILGKKPSRYQSVYENNDLYYLAGHYNPSSLTLTLEPGVQ